MRTSLHRILTTAGAALLLGSLAAPVRADILYVSDYKLGSIGRIEKIDANGVSSIVPISGATNVRGLAFDSAGNLYVANLGDGGNDTILRFSPDGGTSVFASGFKNPMGIAFDSAGNLFVANNFDGEIIKVTSDGISSVFANGLNNPTGLAFDSAGDLYASTHDTNTIVKFTPDGVSSVFADYYSGVLTPGGLAFDSSGYLYVANYGEHSDATIMKFSPDGVGSVFASTALNGPLGLSFGPLGLAFDSAGDLYAGLANTNRIMKFSDDDESVFATVGTYHPQFFAFTDDAGVPLKLPIPEPTTLALLALGLPALLGFSRPRRFSPFTAASGAAR